MEKAEREKAEREKEEEALKIFYLCNGAMAGCPKTNCYKNGGWCDHTSDINAAVNFEKGRRLFYEEKGEMEKEKSPWALFFEDIENRVAEECERLKKEANPKKEMKDYIRQTAWMEPELASYLQKKMSKILNQSVSK